jgi:predicted anti-sigma-YlaC factor YlaD
MTCREFVDFIRAYRDGELAGDVEREFRFHLKNCAPCTDYLRDYGEIVALAKGAYADLDQSVPEDVPEGLVQAVLAGMRKSKK